MSGLRAVAVAALLGLAMVGAPRAAGADHERPPTRNLVGVGLLMGIPAYWAGVAWHEGAHAMAGKAFGLEVVTFKLYPHVDPDSGAFFFGRTVVRGGMSRGEKAVFYLAPRFVDLTLLGTYGALVFTDTLPHDSYAQVALAVFATAAWVDFSKDLYRWHEANDLNRFHTLYGRTSEWQRLPWRLLHAGMIVATGYVVARGYEELFRDDEVAAIGPEPTMVVPLMTSRF